MPKLAGKDLTEITRQWEDLPRERALVLLPLRVETRYEEVGHDRWHLKVRVYPDALHAEVTSAAPSEAERARGREFWAGPADADAFAALAAACGGPWRALAVADATGPTPGPTATAPRARAALLPKRWAVFATDRKGFVMRFCGEPIPRDLPLHPNWEALADPATPLAGGLPAADPARWLVDFDAAVAVGMGLRLDLPEDHEELRSLVVVGLRGDADDGEQLAGLLRAHLRSDGLGLLFAGTPTNNTDDEPAGAVAAAGAHVGLTRVDRAPTSRFTTSLLEEGTLAGSGGLAVGAGAGTALARALGLRDSVLPLLPGGDVRLDEPRAAVQHLVRVAGFEPWLRQQGATDEQAQAIGGWFEDWVRADGPLPLLRVGKQPYGVLPVGRGLADQSPLEDKIARLVVRLRERWAAAVALVPRVDPAADDASDDEAAIVGQLAAALQRHPEPTVFSLRDLASASAPTIATTIAALDGLQAPLVAALQRLPNLDRLQQTQRLMPLVPKVLTARSVAWQLEAVGEALTQLGGDLPAALRGWRDDAVAALKTLKGQLKRAQAPAELLDGFEAPGPGRGSLTADSPAALELTLQVTSSAWRGGLVGDPGWMTGLARALRDETAPPAPAAGQPLWQQVLLLHAKELVLRCRVALLEKSVRGGYRRRRDRLCQALDRLAKLERAEVEALLRGAIGTCVYRLDAWLTGLSTAGLSRTVAAQLKDPKASSVVGGFACVLDLKPDRQRPPRPSAGHVLAPSLTHARMAALLRSGYAAYGDAAGFSVDLSSDRVRLARELFDGVRQGQGLGELLGERFERRLHAGGAADLIPEFRRAVLAGLGQADTPPHAIVDGVVLARARRAAWQAGQELDASEREVAARVKSVGDGREAAQQALAELDEALDALADTSLADALHGLLEGDDERVRATLEAIDRGRARPPQLEGLALQRGGPAIHHQVAVILPAAPERPGPGLGAVIEPGLDAWVGSIVAADQRFAFVAVDPAGVAAPRAMTASIAELGGGPLDLVALAPGGVLAGSVLERLLVARVGDAAPDTAWRIDADAGPGEVPALAELLAAAAWVQEALARAETLTPDHLTATPGATPPALVEQTAGLAAERRARLLARLAEVAALAVRGAPPSAAELAQARLLLTALSERPLPLPAASDPALRAWLAAASAGASARVQALPAGAGALCRLAGDWVPAPRSWGAPEAAGWLWRPAQGKQCWAVPAARGAAVQQWLDLLGPTRPQLGALSAALQAAEALGRAPPAPLAYQSPAGGGWVGVGPPRAAGPRDTVGLVVFGPRSGHPVGALAGLVIDGFTERIPEREVGGGVTFHWNAPVARAPQTILVADPPSATAWTPEGLAKLVVGTVELARERMVAPEDLLRAPTTGLGHFLPALALPDGVVSAASQALLEVFRQGERVLARDSAPGKDRR